MERDQLLIKEELSFLSKVVSNDLCPVLHVLLVVDVTDQLSKQQQWAHKVKLRNDQRLMCVHVATGCYSFCFPVLSCHHRNAYLQKLVRKTS
jgi:hypothetical protein